MGEALPKRIIKINPKGYMVRIIPISCIHIGHKNYKEEYVKSTLRYIQNTPDTYAVILGDTCENVLPETTMRHHGAFHEQVMGLEEQRAKARELLGPIVKANKVLAWTESNHSLRSWYQAGFSVERSLAEALNTTFDGLDALIEIHVKKQVYFLHCTHGVGSSTSLQSVTQKLEKQAARIVNADVYVRGHHHHPCIHKTTQIDGKTGEIRKKLLVATGSFMGYYDGYGHRAEYKPTVLGCVKVKLYRDKWDIHATL